MEFSYQNMPEPVVRYTQKFSLKVTVRAIVDVIFNENCGQNPRLSVGAVPMVRVYRQQLDEYRVKETYVCMGVSPALFLVGLSEVDGYCYDKSNVLVAVGTFSELFSVRLKYEHQYFEHFEITFTAVPNTSAPLVEFAQVGQPDIVNSVFNSQIDPVCDLWREAVASIHLSQHYADLLVELLHSSNPNEYLESYTELKMRWDVYYKRFDYQQLLKNRMS